MSHPVRKIYKEGSPGFLRKLRGVTLSQIKKQVAADPTERREFVVQGLLGERKR